MASACLYLFFAKPNLIVNTDLLIILIKYFSLICKAEILYPPQLYLKRSILIQDPWRKRLYKKIKCSVCPRQGQVWDSHGTGMGRVGDRTGSSTISQPKLGQIVHVGVVLKTSGPADFKSALGFEN